MPSSNFRSHKLFTATVFQSSDHVDSSSANSTLQEVILDENRAQQKGTELQSKNLEMGLLSVYITNCLSSF